METTATADDFQTTGPASEAGGVGADGPAEQARGTRRGRLQAAIEAGGRFETEVHRDLAAETPIVDVRDFNLYYGQKQALWDVNMMFPHGRVTALIGPSGCGKSTLLRSVNRLNDLIDTVRIEGNMLINGDPVYAKNVDVIELRKRMGMVFQKSNPFPMSIFENVVFSIPHRRRTQQTRVGGSLPRSPFAARRCGTRSRTACTRSALGLSAAGSSSGCASPARSQPSRRSC